MNYKGLHWKKFFWVVPIVAALIGFVAGDLASFRSDDRQALDREFSEVQQEARKVLDDIRVFADKALDRGDVGSEDLRRFKNNITRLHQSAKEVSQRVPEVAPEFEAYANAMIDLQRSASSISGSLDARSFVESVSSFVKAQDEFNGKVQNIQKSYF